MSTPDYDDPAVEEQWCAEARARVAEYLSREGVVHGRIGEWPAWHVAPVVSVWAIESRARRDWVGWWVICGDLPTDYVSSRDVRHPRAAVAAFAELWTRHAEARRRGEPGGDFTVGDGSEGLLDLLESRAAMLARWAEDDGVWGDVGE